MGQDQSSDISKRGLQTRKAEQDRLIEHFSRITHPDAPQPRSWEFWENNIRTSQLTATTALLSHYKGQNVSLALCLHRRLLGKSRQPSEHDYPSDPLQVPQFLFREASRIRCPDAIVQLLVRQQHLDSVIFDDQIPDQERKKMISLKVPEKSPDYLKRYFNDRDTIPGEEIQVAVTRYAVENPEEALLVLASHSQTTLLKSICLPNQEFSHLGTLMMETVARNQVTYLAENWNESFIIPKGPHDPLPFGQSLDDLRGDDKPMFVVAPFANGDPGVQIKRAPRRIVKSILQPVNMRLMRYAIRQEYCWYTWGRGYGDDENKEVRDSHDREIFRLLRCLVNDLGIEVNCCDGLCHDGYHVGKDIGTVFNAAALQRKYVSSSVLFLLWYEFGAVPSWDPSLHPDFLIARHHQKGSCSTKIHFLDGAPCLWTPLNGRTVNVENTFWSEAVSGHGDQFLKNEDEVLKLCDAHHCFHFTSPLNLLEVSYACDNDNSLAAPRLDFAVKLFGFHPLEGLVLGQASGDLADHLIQMTLSDPFFCTIKESLVIKIRNHFVEFFGRSDPWRMFQGIYRFFTLAFSFAAELIENRQKELRIFFGSLFVDDMGNTTTLLAKAAASGQVAWIPVLQKKLNVSPFVIQPGFRGPSLLLEAIKRREVEVVKAILGMMFSTVRGKFQYLGAALRHEIDKRTRENALHKLAILIITIIHPDSKERINRYITTDNPRTLQSPSATTTAGGNGQSTTTDAEEEEELLLREIHGRQCESGRLEKPGHLIDLYQIIYAMAPSLHTDEKNKWGHTPADLLEKFWDTGYEEGFAPLSEEGFVNRRTYASSPIPEDHPFPEEDHPETRRGKRGREDEDGNV